MQKRVGSLYLPLEVLHVGMAGGGGPHQLLHADHTDTLPASPVRGDILVANATPAWSRLAKGTVGKVPRSDGTDVLFATLGHGDLGGITADQHHAQVHATAHHTGGGDLLSLGSIPGSLVAAQHPVALGADLHHARDHDIIGTTHTGFPGGTTNFLRADGTFNAPGGSTPEITRLALAAGGSGAAGADITWVKMTSDIAVIALGPQPLFTLTGVGAGIWTAKVFYRYWSDTAGSGAGFSANHTGTVGFWLMNCYIISTGGAAATGLHDQTTSTGTGQMAEGKAERAKNTQTSLFTGGVDTMNADMLAYAVFLFEVTVSGSLVIQGGAEVVNDVTFKAGTSLELHKIG